MSIKMLAIDLDGTLLSSAKTILPATQRALEEAKAGGIKVVLASGRPLSGIKEYADQLGLKGRDEYAILFNGAIVQNLDQEVLISHELDMQDFNTFVHMQRLSHVNLTFETPERFYSMDKKLSIRMQVDGAETKNQLWLQDREDFKKTSSSPRLFIPAMTQSRWTASGTGCQTGSSKAMPWSAAGPMWQKQGH